MMPEMNGYDVIKEFRDLEEEYIGTQNGRAKIAVVSGIEKKDFIIKALSEFCDSYIEKPVKKSDFKKLIKQLYPFEKIEKA
jgi:CheY-like chemotaxis protein